MHIITGLGFRASCRFLGVSANSATLVTKGCCTYLPRIATRKNADKKRRIHVCVYIYIYTYI